MQENSLETIPEDTHLPTDTDSDKDDDEERSTQEKSEEDPSRTSLSPTKTPGNGVTYNTPTPANNKPQEALPADPENEPGEKLDFEEEGNNPQLDTEHAAAALDTNILPTKKEDQAVIVIVEKETTTNTENTELKTDMNKSDSRGPVSPSVKEIKGAIEAKEEELAKIRKSTRIPPTRRKGTPEKANPLGLTGTPTEETMSTNPDIRNYMTNSTKKLKENKRSAPSKLKPPTSKS